VGSDRLQGPSLPGSIQETKYRLKLNNGFLAVFQAKVTITKRIFVKESMETQKEQGTLTDMYDLVPTNEFAIESIS